MHSYLVFDFTYVRGLLPVVSGGSAPQVPGAEVRLRPLLTDTRLGREAEPCAVSGHRAAWVARTTPGGVTRAPQREHTHPQPLRRNESVSRAAALSGAGPWDRRQRRLRTLSFPPSGHGFPRTSSRTQHGFPPTCLCFEAGALFFRHPVALPAPRTGGQPCS